MKQTALAAGILLALGSSGVASAGDELENRMQRMEERLRYLETRVRAQDDVIKEKDAQLAKLAENSADAEGGEWFSKVEIGGVVEVEAGYTDPEGGSSESDAVLATVELGIAVQINDWVEGEVVLLYEDDGDTALDVDVAAITVANPDSNWYARGGQYYVPFGVFETQMVSDTLTLELGETRETALELGIENDGFTGSVYAFNGDITEGGGSEEIDGFGVNAGFARASEQAEFTVNVGYISNIADSDSVQDYLQDGPFGGNNINSQVPAVTAFGMLSAGRFTLIGEYLAATEQFQVAEMPFNGQGAEPMAWGLEAGVAVELAGKEAGFAIGYQGTDEALELELPETRWLAALSIGIADNTSLSFEWAHDSDYGVADGGTGNDTDTLTAQVAVEF